MHTWSEYLAHAFKESISCTLSHTFTHFSRHAVCDEHIYISVWIAAHTQWETACGGLAKADSQHSTNRGGTLTWHSADIHKHVYLSLPLPATNICLFHMIAVMFYYTQ